MKNVGRTKLVGIVSLLLLFTASVYAASFYRAYCDTDGKWLGQWSADKTVAKNSKNHHLRSNSGHSVSIETK